MKLTKVISGLVPREIRVDDDLEITMITPNSIEVEQGAAFFAAEGAVVDGHKFIPQALAAGAVVVVGTVRSALLQVPNYILVDDIRDALAVCAYNFYGRPAVFLDLVGITGTNGKTTCTYLLEGALRECGKRPGVIGTIDARFGDTHVKLKNTTPAPVELCSLLARMVEAGVDCAVAEISSHGIHQGRANRLEFRVVIFTNLSHDHLDYHGSEEEYGEVKARLFTELLPAGSRGLGAVINADDPWGRRIAARLGYRHVTYGIDSEQAQVRAVDIKTTVKGSRFTVQGPWGTTAVRSALVGRYNVLNILAALATVHLMGLDVGQAALGIGKLRVIPGRLEPIANPFGQGIWVDYCHTPDALEKVLTALRSIVPGRLITVFGAGGDRDQAKRPEMGRTVEALSDVAVVTSDNPRFEDPCGIIDQILSGMSGPYRFTSTLVVPDRAMAIAAAIGLAREGDGILIGGKGHEDRQAIGKETHRFDDREVAQKVVRELELGGR